ncbi:MAG: LD-carboxypeptidase [candidate division NC10 bacterium]|nr:LD-carboxypeptidase [candidate division NC10 bacterium]
MAERRLRIPQRLRPGDTLGVVAPSGPPERGPLKRGLRALERLGPFTLRLAPNLDARWGYLAGRDAERAAGIMAMVTDPGVRGIMCARGGYGAGRLLEHLDFSAFRRHPKVFVGSSDVTILLLALLQRAGLVVFHGPMVAPDFGLLRSRRTRESVRALLLHPGRRHSFSAAGRWWGGPGPTPLRGPLTGGNLTLVAASLGTRDEIRTAGRVLFLEDVNEEPYRVDRMLWQLRAAGKLRGLRGLLYGEFTRCRSVPGRPSRPLAEVLEEYAAAANTPCFGPIPAGHRRDNVVLPLGGWVACRPEGAGRARLTLGY